MDLVNATIAAGGESAEISVSPGALYGLNCSAPCQVLAKNGADGGASWGVLYNATTHDVQWIKPTSDTIKIKAGDRDTRVALFEDES